MRTERGQATVEWAGLLLLVALALLALGRLASGADGKELGTTVLDAQVHAARGAPGGDVGGALEGAAGEAGERAVETPGGVAGRPALRRAVRLALSRAGAVALLRQEGAALPRAGRAAGAVWRKAWFGCLVYERIRYAVRHPESRLPGYTFPYVVAARIVTRCVSPVDLLRDLPALEPGS